MEYRLLGGSGFSVPVLSLGTGTFRWINPTDFCHEQSASGATGSRVDYRLA
jgi:hypothetical protein